MKRKIVLLPLDERPCNAGFPQKLFGSEQLEILLPPCLGQKKKPADGQALEAFLLSQCRDANGLVLSMDMLLYGGLLPSRVHNLEAPVVRQRMELVRQLKKKFPDLVIYAFQCIMRCPAYSSSDEEPDYYGQWGAQIHQSGDVKHRSMLGLCSSSALEAAFRDIPEDALEDYLNRRAFNLGFNKDTLELVRDGVIDFLVVPQDDSARYGYTALDQQEVRSCVIDMHLQSRVLMYPGADEVALTLLSRMVLSFEKKCPSVYLKYAATEAVHVIPAYEDRTLGETVKCHLLAAGCTAADTAAEADFILAIDCPAGDMKESVMQPVRNGEYCVERNLTEFVLYLQRWVQRGKPVAVCDNAYANGGDLELIDLMDRLHLLDKVAGYAGWNTSANTLGTAIAQGVCCLVFGNDRRQKDFLMLRYVEDVGYCSVVRRYITEHRLEEMGMDYFNVRDQQGAMSREVRDRLGQFIQRQLPSLAGHIELTQVKMPWRRMFEADLQVRWVP
ncbi:MAG: DUF4127 family protein [Eubacteriales bacterium]|nr:DUF4127 family protein [Eubacteriales bacterium]